MRAGTKEELSKPRESMMVKLAGRDWSPEDCTLLCETSGASVCWVSPFCPSGAFVAPLPGWVGFIQGALDSCLFHTMPVQSPWEYPGSPALGQQGQAKALQIHIGPRQYCSCLSPCHTSGVEAVALATQKSVEMHSLGSAPSRAPRLARLGPWWVRGQCGSGAQLYQLLEPRSLGQAPEALVPVGERHLRQRGTEPWCLSKCPPCCVVSYMELGALGARHVAEAWHFGAASLSITEVLRGLEI